MPNDKPYYHLTVKAFLDPSHPEAEEWAWVTLVEALRTVPLHEDNTNLIDYNPMPQRPELAFVRGAAWRSFYRHVEVTPSGDVEMGWEESPSESVFFKGRPIDGQTNQFDIGFTTATILLENGNLLDPMRGEMSIVDSSLGSSVSSSVGSSVSPSLDSLFSSPLGVLGAFSLQPAFSIQPVNYEDPFVNSRCGEQEWCGQYWSLLNNFSVRISFIEEEDEENELPELVDEALDQLSIPPNVTIIPPFGTGLDVVCAGLGVRFVESRFVYTVIRSSSREHPHWMLREI